MMSDFIDETNGYWWLTDEEFKKASEQNIIKKEARDGENKESYWTAAKLGL